MKTPSFRVKLFHLWFRIARPMTMGVRIFVQNSKQEVLLVRHGYVAGWHLPGGGIEAGETSMQAAEKELFEETGLTAEGQFKLISIYANQRVSRRDHVLVYQLSHWGRGREFTPIMKLKK